MNVASPDGTRISFEVEGDGPPLLLLHGFSNDRTMWSRIGWVGRLRADFTVITMDIRGCGDSEKPELAAAYSLDRHLADIKAVLSSCGVGRPVVWGWSLGATIALHFAKRGEPVATVASGSYFGPIFTPTYVESWLADSSTELERARWQGLGTWPAVGAAEVRGRLLVCTGTRDGNVVSKLEDQRDSIEAMGGRLHVFSGLNHIELITVTKSVAPVIEAFLHAAV
jgi:pimeloyl-ACP methyl ester carboxylesterase